MDAIESVIENIWVQSLLLSFLFVGLLEYAKHLLKKNLPEKVFFIFKDHVLPFFPIILGVCAHFIKPLHSERLFSMFFYIVSIHLIFKIFFQIIIERIKLFIRNFKK